MNLKIVIPAAGQGTRLRPFTENLPKVLVEVAGKPILERQLEEIGFENISELVLITGYEREKLVQWVEDKGFPFKVTFYHNPSYAESQCAYSLMCAKKSIGDGFIYINSDLLFAKEDFQSLVNSEHENLVAVRAIENYQTDLQQAIIEQSTGKVSQWKLRVPENNVEIVGPVKISKNYFELLSRHYEECSEEQRLKYPCYTFFSSQLSKAEFYSHTLINDHFFEIDTVEDKEKAEECLR